MILMAPTTYRVAIKNKWVRSRCTSETYIMLLPNIIPINFFKWLNVLLHIKCLVQYLTLMVIVSYHGGGGYYFHTSFWLTTQTTYLKCVSGYQELVSTEAPQKSFISDLQFSFKNKISFPKPHGIAFGATRTVTSIVFNHSQKV